jgi:hypothetical protein
VVAVIRGSLCFGASGCFLFGRFLTLPFASTSICQFAGRLANWIPGHDATEKRRPMVEVDLVDPERERGVADALEFFERGSKDPPLSLTKHYEERRGVRCAALTCRHPLALR